MLSAAKKGFINATDLADYMVGRGIAFRDAYHISGRLVHDCIAAGKTLETLSLEEYRAVSPLFDEDVYEAIDLMTCVNLRTVPGGPAPSAVRTHLDQVRAWLSERKA